MLTRLAKGQSCVSCGYRDKTVVWAHSNLLEHGKGRGLKSHDGAGMLLCHKCHYEIDQGKMSRQEKRDFILSMIVKTYMQLWESGLIEVKK